MEEEIASIIKYRTLKYHFLITDDIEKIIDIYVTNSSIPPLETNINYGVAPRGESISSFDLLNYAIDFYLYDVISWLTCNFKYYNFYDLNLLIAMVVLHELIHATQFQRFISNASDFETQIIKDNYDYFYGPNKLVEHYRKHIYRKYHDIFPFERMADIDSSLISTRIAAYLPTKMNFNNVYYEYLTSYYFNPKTNYSPLEFYTKVVHSNLIKSQPFYSKSRNTMLCNVQDLYSLIDRLRLGLPISNDEYKLTRNPNNFRLKK